MKAEALIDTLPDAPPETKEEKLNDTLCNVEVEALVVWFAATQLDGKAVLKRTLGYAEGQATNRHAIWDSTWGADQDTLHPLRDVKIDPVNVTLSEVEASKVVDSWADTVGRLKIRTVDDTLGQ